MNNPISPEQALEILKKLNLISLEGELHGTVVMNADQYTAFANAVLAEYLGEPVAWGIVELYEDGEEFLTEACIDKDELDDAKEQWLDQSEIKTIPLYARKE